MKDQVLSQAEIDALFSQMGQAGSQPPAQPGQPPAPAAGHSAPQAGGPAKASFPDLNPTPSPAPAVPAAPATVQGRAAGAAALPIALLSDVELEVTVQLGQTSRSIREILEMSPGAVLELDRLAGDAVDILVNGRLVAKAEVVVIGDNFGVRITELIKPEGVGI